MTPKIKNLLSVVAKKPHLFFATTTLLFGLIFMVLIPPFQTPDEEVHFLRAYQVSEFGFVANEQDGVVGGSLPRSIGATTKAVGVSSLAFHSENKYSIKDTKTALGIPLDKDNRRHYDITAASSYSPIGYIPQAIGIAIGKLFNSPVVVLLYMARLANLITWVLIGFLAIKIIPSRKWTVAAIGILPMMVAQAVSVGVDVVSIGSLLLFMVLVMRQISSSRRLATAGYVSLIATASVAALSKPLSILVLPLALLLKSNSMPRLTYGHLLKAILIVVPIIIFIAWTYITKDIGQNTSQIANGQNTVGQLKYLVSEPWMSVVVLFNTLFFTWGDSVWVSLIGNFGWVDTPLSGMFVLLGYIYLGYVLLVKYEKKGSDPPRLQNIFIVTISALYFLMVFASMYIMYSPLRFDIVTGVQGRYLIPVLLMLASTGLCLARSTATQYRRVVMSLGLTLLVASVLTIFFRYYLTYI